MEGLSQPSVSINLRMGSCSLSVFDLFFFLNICSKYLSLVCFEGGLTGRGMIYAL